MDFENVEKKDGTDLFVKNLRQELFKKLSEYQRTLNYMCLDAPLGVLCLPDHVENILSANGCLRVYDIVNLDLGEVEGLDDSSIREITSRVEEFFPMS